MFKPQIKGYKSTIGNNFKNVVIDLDNKKNIEKSINDSLKKKDDVSLLYSELNKIVYEIYGMDKDDIITIENSIKS